MLPCMQRLRYFGHPEELQDYLDEGGACGSSHRSTEAVLNVVNSNFLELDLLVEVGKGPSVLVGSLRWGGGTGGTAGLRRKRW